ncbi:MAG: lipopolysaccharide heptosyltransferase II [Planctomycetota bacterium]
MPAKTSTKDDSLVAADAYNAPMTQPAKIAVLLPNWVGDVVMATPVLRALREHFAGSHITHVGAPVALETLDGDLPGSNSALQTGEGDENAARGMMSDEQIADLSREDPKLRNFLRIVRRMHKERFDLVVLLPNSFRSALLCWLGRAKRIVGYDRDGRGWMLTDKIAPLRDENGDYKPIPTMDYYCELVRSLGVISESRRMSLGVTPDAEQEAESLFEQTHLDRSRPIVMLNPGASFGPSKLWPADRYAAVADTLSARWDAQIIINAAPSEREVAKEVARSMMRRPAINLALRDNSISLLKSLLRRCSLLITNDTGARHVAAAMGIAVVTIFGSTDPTWSQIDYPRERIVRAEVSCAPCQSKVCFLPYGPTYHRCMTAVSIGEVLSAAEELLELNDEKVRKTQA